MRRASVTVETLSAYLPSVGLNYRKATKHIYSHSEPKTVRNGSKTLTGFAHMFKCIETGELRQWGFDLTFAAVDN